MHLIIYLKKDVRKLKTSKHMYKYLKEMNK